MKLSHAIRRMNNQPRRQRKFAKVMREGYAGSLHSGSSSGPIVTNPAQMKAIAASESGMARRARRRAY